MGSCTGKAGCLQEPAPNGFPDPSCATSFAGSLIQPTSVAVSGDGKLVVAGGAGAVLVATRASTGALTPVQCFAQTASAKCTAIDGLGSVAWIRFTPDDQQVYVGSGGGTIAVFNHNTSTNRLNHPSNDTGCYTSSPTVGCTTLNLHNSALDAAFAPGGGSLYVVGNSGLFVVDRGPTGVLSAATGVPGSTCVANSGAGGGCLELANFSGARSVIVTPDGANVVAGLSNGNSGSPGENGGVWSFQRLGSGKLNLGSCVQEHATTACTGAIGVRNAQSLAIGANGFIYEAGAAGDVGGVIVLKHDQSGDLTRVECYSPPSVSGCQHLLPTGAQTPAQVSFAGGYVHALMGGVYLALTAHKDGTLTSDSGKIRCRGQGTASCPAFRPSGALPAGVTAFGGTSYLADPQARGVLAFHAPVVLKKFTKAPTPTISGIVKVGKTLSAHHGTWQPVPTFSYQWLANGNPISGATRATFVIKAAQKGKRISVRVRGTKAGYVVTMRTSASTVRVP